MKNSPFIYGSMVSSHAFTNREAETEKLTRNLVGGINTMIMSPRRWGKSSLVQKVVEQIQKKDKNRKVVMLDIFMVNSIEEFLELFAREVIKSSSSRWEEWVNSGKTLFHRLIPKLSVGIDPLTDFSISFDWEELRKHQDEILNLPEIIAQKKNIDMIICLDEFQNLALFQDYPILEKKMRAVWQKQKRVTYCLYGSKRHMMADIFNTPSKPFYRFGDIMLLPKIQRPKWIKFITEGFVNNGKKINIGMAEKIPSLMKDHSWYVQQLAHYTFNATHQMAGKAELYQALREVLNANGPLYQKELEHLSVTQINLLKVVAHNEVKWTSTSLMQRYNIGTPRNILKNKQILIQKDIIHEVDGIYEFLDPVFELWFRNYLGIE